MDEISLPSLISIRMLTGTSKETLTKVLYISLEHLQTVLGTRHMISMLYFRLLEILTVLATLMKPWGGEIYQLL